VLIGDTVAAMSIEQRKADHIELCSEGDVGFARKTTLLEQVELIHDALPELAYDDIDGSTTVLGKTLKLPLFIAAMTGGTEQAETINRHLAAIAEERAIGFGFGSQRPMLKGSDLGYRIRDVAPTALVLGNLGAVQARQMSSDALSELTKRVGADALCLHLNPAMELIQPGGDRDFRDLADTLRRCCNDLPVPVIAKETGCGIGANAAAKIRNAGVAHVDVSGAGGTSWVAVERERADGGAKRLGRALSEWGIPTAASVVFARRAHFDTIIATGGIASGGHVARAIALGASAAGIARPVLQAFQRDGRSGVMSLLDDIEAELKATMLLVGASNIAAMRSVPRVLGGALQRWITTP